MRHDDGRRRCGLCGKVFRPYDSISVTDVGDRCFRWFNQELADRLGVGGPPADDRLASQVSSQPTPAVPAAAVRPGASNRTAGKRRRPTAHGLRARVGSTR